MSHSHSPVPHHHLLKHGWPVPHSWETQSFFVFLRTLQSVQVLGSIVYWDKPCSCHTISLAEEDKVSAHASLAASYNILISIIPFFRQESKLHLSSTASTVWWKKLFLLIVQQSIFGGIFLLILFLQLRVYTSHLCQQRQWKIQDNWFH